jgi:Mrp family chromosome partitioning ATPase
MMKQLPKITKEIRVGEQTSLLSDEYFSYLPTETVNGLRQLVSRLNQKGRFPGRLALVSALRGEGVTFLSQALAATAANDLERRFCLIDLNFWHPNPDPNLFRTGCSLADVIAGKTLLDDALVTSNWPNLTILPAGDIPPPNRSRTANSQILKDIIEELHYRFDHLILDIPAILQTPEAVTLASLGDAACLVIQQGVTNAEDVYQALDEIESMNIIGAVLNRYSLLIPDRLVKIIAG